MSEWTVEGAGGKVLYVAEYIQSKYSIGRWVGWGTISPKFRGDQLQSELVHTQ